MIHGPTNIKLAWFLWSKNFSAFSSIHVLYCFRSNWSRLSLAEICIWSVTFSQTLFMCPLSYTFSKAANLFEILIWYYSYISSLLASWDLISLYHTYVSILSSFIYQLSCTALCFFTHKLVLCSTRFCVYLTPSSVDLIGVSKHRNG